MTTRLTQLSCIIFLFAVIWFKSMSVAATSCTEWATRCSDSNCLVKIMDCLSWKTVDPSTPKQSLLKNYNKRDTVATDLLNSASWLTSFTAIAGKEGDHCPDGYKKIWSNLNKGTSQKGDHIYFCYINGENKPPITSINFVTGENQLYENACPFEYEFVDVDLNKGAQGKFIYACYSRSTGCPIDNITIVSNGSPLGPEKCPGETFVKQDLNEGAQGDYIYLCYHTNPNAIDHIDVSHVNYDLKNLYEDSKTLKTIDEIVIDNPLDVPYSEAKTGRSYETTSESSWSTTNNVEFGIKMSITAGIPEIASVSWEISYGQSINIMSGGSYSETQTHQYEFGCVAPPKSKVICSATFREAKVNVSYHAMARYYYANGTIITIPINGTYKGVAVSSLEINTKEISRETAKLMASYDNITGGYPVVLQEATNGGNGAIGVITAVAIVGTAIIIVIIVVAYIYFRQRKYNMDNSGYVAS